jgi:hypothetical protein
LEEIKIAYTNLLKEPEENMPFERSMWVYYEINLEKDGVW